MILIKGEIRIPNYLMTSSIKSKFIEKLTYISDAWVEGEVDTFLDYREVGNYFCVPIEALGMVKKLFPDVQIVDKRNNVVYGKDNDSDLFRNIKSNIVLRDYQTAIINKLFDVVKTTDKKSGIVKADVGSGKTIMMLYLAFRLKRKTLILVHRENLLTQFMKTIFEEKMLEGVRVGIFKGNKKDIENKEIVIGMIETAMSFDNVDVFDSFGLLLVDECERSAAPVYINAVKNCSAMYKFGFSATPKRRDAGRYLLSNNIGEVLVDAISMGFGGSPVKPYVCIVGTEFKIYSHSEPKKTSAFYENKINANSDRNDMIVKMISFLLSDVTKNILVMTNRKEMAMYYHRFFSETIPSSVCLTGDTVGSNPELLIKAKTSRLVFANKQYIGVGVSLNQLNTLIFAGFIEGGLQQKVGRITRANDGVNRLVIDIVDNRSELSKTIMEKKKKEYKNSVMALSIHYITWSKFLNKMQSENVFNDTILINDENKINGE